MAVKSTLCNLANLSLLIVFNYSPPLLGEADKDWVMIRMMGG